MEFYQWLLRQNGFAVSNDGFFVYCNGDKSLPRFDEKINFKVSILKYTGSTEWIQPTIFEIKETLDSKTLPSSSKECNYCVYTEDRKSVEKLDS
jgi:hypothetical protein